MSIDNSLLLDQLKWRGLIFQSTDEKELSKTLSGKPIKFYCGFDPTAPSLHIGNLVQLILMKHLQTAGHQPVCVVGGATGLIGDPRLTGERIMNDKEVVDGWVDNLTKQFQKFLSSDGENPLIVVNNYEWTSKINAIDFLRDIGKNFRVGAMLSKDTVASRLKSEDGLSYTEFSYQVLQGYDFYYLNKNYDVVLQTGGQDQWGNLTSGLDLIHKLTDNSVHVITTPLITDANGNKFGKSEGGAVWLNDEMMSVYKFYQFWLNTSDEEVIKLLKIFTFLDKDKIEELSEEVKNNPENRMAQKVLAKEVTTFVHGENSLEVAINASNALFGKGSLSDLNEENLSSSLNGVEIVSANIGDDISKCFVDAKLSTSFSDYRKTLAQGGVYINNNKITDLDIKVNEDLLLSGGYIVLRKGKKNIAAIKV